MRTLTPLRTVSDADTPRLLTERLTVRVAQPSDVGAIVRYVTANAAFLQPWEPLRPAAYFTAEYWRAQVARDVEDSARDRGVRFFLFDRASHGAEVVGVATFGNVVRGAAQYCTLGYALSEAVQGRGLMCEALEHAAIPYVFNRLRLHRIHATYIPRNERSGGLLRRLGFVVEGYARDYLLINGVWEDHILTALANPYWSARQE
jgi:ribosomal-protein-alanine N-acetyltransferase